MMFPPLFSAKRIRLATPLSEDKATFVRWSQDDDYTRMLDDDPIRPLSEGNFGHFDGSASPENPYFHLRTLEDDTLIGFVVLFNIKWGNQSAEMAIGIGEKNYRKKGYGSEALALILNYAFNELNLYRVGLTVISYNTDAIKAYERVGFVQEGIRRKAVQRHGVRYDLVQYGILRDEWKGQPQP
jgi:RimJ/RimL family protein N-acetyltransferase